MKVSKLTGAHTDDLGRNMRLRDHRWPSVFIYGCPNGYRGVHQRDARDGVCHLCCDGPGSPIPLIPK